MEHIPSPANPCQPLRCVCSPEALKQMKRIEASFFDFPAAAGISLMQVKQGRLDDNLTRQRLDVFLQSWLYIRLLEDVLGTVVLLDLVTEYDESTKRWYLFTGNLPSMLAQLNHVNSPEQAIRIKIVLAEARVVLNRIANNTQEPVAAIISGELEVVLWTLIQTLEFALLPDELPRQRVSMDDGGRICTLLTNKLRGLQWCPNQVDMLAHSLDVPSLYYASLLGREKNGKDHGKCSQRECVANKFVQSEYRTKHFECGGECAFVGADSEMLQDIVKTEDIPVIEILDTDDTNQLVIQVHPESAQTPYVAISHVWADGMGNPGDNSLPACQLHRLHDLVKRLLPDRPLFWCDTLCVPTKSQELRRQAIWKMKAVYERAAHVLVIDSGLIAASSKAPPEELLMRITCCGWVRRLWTFQEKNLARRLHVVMEDAIVRVQHLHYQVMTCKVKPEAEAMSARFFSSSIALEATSFLRGPQKKAEDGTDKALDFGSAWEGLQWRATSWASDEPVCLAVALGVDLRGILELPEDTELRMRAILSQQTGFPPYMIFAPIPRMKDMGWKWAPPSLMRPRAISGSKLHHMTNTTRWQPEGLVVQFPGFVARLFASDGTETVSDIRHLPVTVGSFLAMKDVNTGTWYCVWRQREEWESTNEEDILNDLVSEKMSSLAVILSCPEEALWPNAERSALRWDGVLVSVKKQEGDVLFVSFVWRLLVGLMLPSDIEAAEKDLAEGPIPVSIDHNRAPIEEADSVYSWVMHCTTMGPSQEWCVG